MINFFAPGHTVPGAIFILWIVFLCFVFIGLYCYPVLIQIQPGRLCWFPRVFGGWADAVVIPVTSSHNKTGKGLPIRFMIRLIWRTCKRGYISSFQLGFGITPQCIVKISFGDIIISIFYALKKRRH